MVDLRVDEPHEARVYDYILGGKDHYPADRAVGDAILQVMPQMPVWAGHNRRFLQRSVAFVAGEGIDQFLDIGTGLPTVANTHEVAEAVNPDARVVYVDYDPLVLAHARVLLESTNTKYILADLRQPAEIIEQARKFLDFDRPITVMLVAILHHLRDDEQPAAQVRTILDAVPVGSYLILSHGTVDFLDPEYAQVATQMYRNAPMTMVARTRKEIDVFIEGLEVVDPGVVPTTGWRMSAGDIGVAPDTSQAGHWAVVARKTR